MKDIGTIEKNIRLAYNTGKVVIGINECKRSVMNGEGKLIILSNDSPKDIKNDITYYSELAQIPLVIYPNSAIRLGETCGRPHPISVMVILNEGDSKVLDVFK
ncbi:50S ribosomal protein L30e [Candidatus Micrarchaeota archaeon]|nr:50S ribosomal protein L30e [Candidatus Micrarchaeota archaeon]